MVTIIIVAALLACLLLMFTVVRNHKKKQGEPLVLNLRTSFTNPLYDDSGANRTDLDDVPSGTDPRMLANPTYVEVLRQKLPGMVINNPAFSGLPEDDWAQTPERPGYLDISPFPTKGSGYLDGVLHARPRPQKERSSRGADYLDVHPVPFTYNAAFTGPAVVELDLDRFMVGRKGSSYTDEPVYACADKPVDIDGEEPAYTRMLGARDVVRYQSAGSSKPRPITAGYPDADEPNVPTASLGAIGAELTTIKYPAASNNPDSLANGLDGDLDIDDVLAYLDDAIAVTDQAASQQHEYDVAAAATVIKSQAAVFDFDPQDQADPKTRPEPDQVIYDVWSPSCDGGLSELYNIDGFEDDHDGFEV